MNMFRPEAEKQLPIFTLVDWISDQYFSNIYRHAVITLLIISIDLFSSCIE